MSLNINIATNRSDEGRQESESASVRLCRFRPYLWCQQYRAGIHGFDTSPVKFPISRDTFICLGNMAFELKMTLAFIFIETLTHRIITKKKHLQIKPRKDIQEVIRKQSSPNEWGFFLFFFMSTQHTLIHYSEWTSHHPVCTLVVKGQVPAHHVETEVCTPEDSSVLYTFHFLIDLWSRTLLNKIQRL